MSNGTISYTHWSYFPDEQSAQQCRQEMAEYITRLIPPNEDRSEYLLLAGRDVSVDDLVERHNEVERIVTRHGGKYDGGEATYSLGTRESLPDEMLVARDGDIRPLD